MKVLKRSAILTVLVVLAGSVVLLASPDIKLRLLEGVREGTQAGPTAVTSSYEKLDMWGTLPADYSLDLEIAKIKKIFNMKDVKLITEANLSWPAQGDKIFHIIQFEEREFLVLVNPRGEGAASKFRVEVFEQKGKDKNQTNLLDTVFQLPAEETVYLGFEDTESNAYFLYLTWPSLGVSGGVAGGISGGVTGGVEGGVEGGVLGGVEGGVEGAVRAVGEVEPPKFIKLVEPIYPAEAKKAGIEGTVILEAATDIYGRVANVKVLRSIPQLDQAAIHALKQWVYEPKKINGKPQGIIFRTTVVFRLTEKKEAAQAGSVKVTYFQSDKLYRSGGMEGGVLGGIEGGVKGGVQGGIIGPQDVESPKLIKRVEPVYPEIARMARQEGVVVLSVTTDVQGKVSAVKILRSIPLLEQSAFDAVKQWVYEPVLVQGKPQPSVFQVTLTFKLVDREKKAVTVGGTEAVRAVGGVNPPKIIKEVAPVYPEIAKQAGVEGVVIVEATTNIYGRVIDTKILRSIPLLDKAAVDAVKQWVYEPVKIKGERKGIIFTVTVDFRLGDKSTKGKILSVSAEDQEFAKGAVKVEGEIKPPRQVKVVNPVYPEVARQAQVEGTVILAVRTDAEGKVKAMKILRSIPKLDQAAIDAVRQWEYEPLLVKGKPVEAVFTVTVRFQLK